MNHSPVTRALFDEVMVPNYAPATIVPVRGEGSRVWDQEGRDYIDFGGGIAVTVLGHAHPKLVAALTEQARKLWHVSNVLTNEPALKLARRLCELTFAQRVFFANSGAEANEAALKLARKWAGHGRHVVISAYGSFHGRTLATLAATGQPAKHEPFHPMPDGFRHVAFNDIDALTAAIDPTVAAVFLEPVQGEGGVIPADPEYLRAVRALCDERNLLLIMDEVQCGYGRTGEWFGFQHSGVVPDVVTMAKAMGNGFPVGACWAKMDVAAAFKPGDHGSTYSGTAIATAVVSAVIDEMRRIDAPRLARDKGASLTSKLSGIPGVSGVRGSGLLLAVELAPGIDAKAVYVALLGRGVVTNAVTASALRLAPPLTVTDAEIDEAVAALASVLQEFIS